jgi:competence protein ComGC
MSTSSAKLSFSVFRNRRRRGSAFTLVELLVVVSVIALLIAVLLPSLRRARDQAKRVKCFANLHAIHIALVCYADDYLQELPSYYTMGQWGFRVRPGTVLKYNSSDGGFPEYHGLQAVLHNGFGPPPLRPNGLPDYRKLLQKPIYLAADSDVWICPGNDGPRGHEEAWREFGNTYYYRTNSAEVNDNPDSEEQFVPTKAYNIDWLNRRASIGALSLLVMDNYIYKPAPSGMGRPEQRSDFVYESSERRAPHRVASGLGKSPSQFWCANYADGHVNMNLWNH